MELLIVAIVTLIMVVFVGFALWKIKEQLEVQINKDVDRLSAYYDAILDDKTAQLEAKIKEIEALEIEKEVEVESVEETPATTIILGESRYVNSDFFKDYNKVKHAFSSVAIEQALEKVGELLEVHCIVKIDAYKEVLDVLDFNVQYNMLTLPVSDQLDVLQEVLGENKDKNNILANYLDQNQEFDLNVFIQYIKDYIFHNDTQIVVGSNTGQALVEEQIKGVTYVKDETIGEGFTVRYKDKLFDYSISLGGNNE